jgi:hypothetical protein
MSSHTKPQWFMFIIQCGFFIDKKIAISLFHKDKSLLILMNERKGGVLEMAPFSKRHFENPPLPYLHFYIHYTLYNQPLLAQNVLLLIHQDRLTKFGSLYPNRLPQYAKIFDLRYIYNGNPASFFTRRPHMSNHNSAPIRSNRHSIR